MLTNNNQLVEQESLLHTDEVLASMKERLSFLVTKRPVCEDDFAEIAAILDNASYIFLYLDSNSTYVDSQWLSPFRRSFFEDSDMDRELLAGLSEVSFADADIDASRLRYVDFLASKLEGRESDRKGQETFLQDAFDQIEKVQQARVDFLKRLGIANVQQRMPEVAIYTLQARASSPVTRSKLGEGFRAISKASMDSLLQRVDSMIASRHAAASEKGWGSPLRRSLRRCSLSQEIAETYILESLERAVVGHAALEDEIRRNVSDVGAPMDHFGYYLKLIQQDRTIPMFALEPCIAYMRKVASDTLDISLKQRASFSDHVLSYEVYRAGDYKGDIHFDLWDVSSKRKTANATYSARNRTSWKHIHQSPIAFVSCRFQKSKTDKNAITFQNVHSLFHEFGHALNHLLIRKRMPNQSGLEYLPLERLEDLSMWFEKWIFHKAFEDFLDADNVSISGLHCCQSIKILEYRRTQLERSVTAALDFYANRDGAPETQALRPVFEDLDRKFGIGRHCALNEFIIPFTWPMLVANPGAYFAYLWGASYSAQKFAPVLDRKLGNMDDLRLFDSLSSCFDPDEPSILPDIETAFDFYQRRWGA